MLCLHCTVDVVVVVCDSRWCEIDDELMVSFCVFEQVAPDWQLSTIMNLMKRSVKANFSILISHSKLLTKLFIHVSYDYYQSIPVTIVSHV